jgi:lipoprotein-anchoring transpeptidase ErfK/SrfK
VVHLQSRYIAWFVALLAAGGVALIAADRAAVGDPPEAAAVPAEAAAMPPEDAARPEKDAAGPPEDAGGPEKDAAEREQAAAEPDVPAGAEPDASAGAEPAAPQPSTVEEPTPAPRLTLDAPDGAHPIVWVRRGREVEIRTEPGGGEVAEVVDKRTEFSSPTVLGVVKSVGRWAAVTTPRMANGELGWVKLDPKRLRAGWTPLSVVIDVSDRVAVLRDEDEVVRSFAVTVGMPGSPTPTGRFSVTDTFRGDLQAAYGCCAVALSATQPHVPSGWLGGNRIAIHGTYGPLGVAASSGCVRAADADVSKLVDRVPLGAPVFIRA